MLNLIEHLPQNSHTMEALLNDADYARASLEAQKRLGIKPKKRGPSLSTWSAEVGLLADLVDAVRENTAVTSAAAGAKTKEPPRYDRPRTAFDLVYAQMREEAHRNLVARVLPKT